MAQPRSPSPPPVVPFRACPWTRPERQDLQVEPGADSSTVFQLRREVEELRAELRQVRERFGAAADRAKEEVVTSGEARYSENPEAAPCALSQRAMATSGGEAAACDWPESPEEPAPEPVQHSAFPVGRMVDGRGIVVIKPGSLGTAAPRSNSATTASVNDASNGWPRSPGRADSAASRVFCSPARQGSSSSFSLPSYSPGADNGSCILVPEWPGMRASPYQETLSSMSYSPSGPSGDWFLERQEPGHFVPLLPLPAFPVLSSADRAAASGKSAPQRVAIEDGYNDVERDFNDASAASVNRLLDSSLSVKPPQAADLANKLDQRCNMKGWLVDNASVPKPPLLIAPSLSSSVAMAAFGHVADDFGAWAKRFIDKTASAEQCDGKHACLVRPSGHVCPSPWATSATERSNSAWPGLDFDAKRADDSIGSSTTTAAETSAACAGQGGSCEIPSSVWPSLATTKGEAVWSVSEPGTSEWTEDYCRCCGCPLESDDCAHAKRRLDDALEQVASPLKAASPSRSVDDATASARTSVRSALASVHGGSNTLLTSCGSTATLAPGAPCCHFEGVCSSGGVSASTTILGGGSISVGDGSIALGLGSSTSTMSGGCYAFSPRSGVAALSSTQWIQSSNAGTVQNERPTTPRLRRVVSSAPYLWPQGGPIGAAHSSASAFPMPTVMLGLERPATPPAVGTWTASTPSTPRGTAAVTAVRRQLPTRGLSPSPSATVITPSPVAQPQRAWQSVTVAGVGMQYDAPVLVKRTASTASLLGSTSKPSTPRNTAGQMVFTAPTPVTTMTERLPAPRPSGLYPTAPRQRSLTPVRADNAPSLQQTSAAWPRMSAGGSSTPPNPSTPRRWW